MRRIKMPIPNQRECNPRLNLPVLTQNPQIGRGILALFYPSGFEGELINHIRIASDQLKVPAKKAFVLVPFYIPMF